MFFKKAIIIIAFLKNNNNELLIINNNNHQWDQKSHVDQIPAVTFIAQAVIAQAGLPARELAHVLNSLVRASSGRSAPSLRPRSRAPAAARPRMVPPQSAARAASKRSSAERCLLSSLSSDAIRWKGYKMCSRQAWVRLNMTTSVWVWTSIEPPAQLPASSPARESSRGARRWSSPRVGGIPSGRRSLGPAAPAMESVLQVAWLLFTQTQCPSLPCW